MQLARRLATPALLTLVSLFAAACDQPPTREILAAEAAVDKARQAEAESYVPDRFREAQAALESAHRQVEARDYRGALSSANSAAERARAAAQAAVAARTLAKSAAEVALGELQTVIDEVATLRQEAEEAKLPAEVFAMVVPRLDSLQTAMNEAQKKVDAGDVLAARQAALELKSQAADLPEAFRQARAAWEEAHPKGKGKGAKPAPKPPAH